MRTVVLSITLFTLLCVDCVKAQTVIDSEDFGAEPGAKFILHRTDYVDHGDNGKNVIWDFTELVVNSSDAIRVLSAEESPYADFFPAADICFDYGHNDFIYSSRGGASLSRLGGIANGTAIVYSDGQELFKFPMTYGDVHTDVFSADYELDDLQIERTGILEVSVVGDGTMVIADDLFTNVLKVKVVETITDSYEIASFPQQMITVNHSYYFVKAGLDDVLLSLHEQSGEEESIVRYGVLLEYKSGDSMLEEAAPLHKVSVSPNPIVDIAHLRFLSDTTADMRIFVLDIEGKELSELRSLKVIPGPVEVQLSLTDLSAGPYLLRLDLVGRSRLVKLVKE